jgi:hypothetical protein
MKTLNKLRCRMQVHIRWVFSLLVVDLDYQKVDWLNDMPVCRLNDKLLD